MFSVVGAVAGALGLAAAAGLAPLSASLHVRRSPTAADCPDAGALSASLTEISRGSTSAAPGRAASVEAEIVFDRGARGYEATLSLRGARRGVRTLTDAGPSCAELGRAVAITLALSLDADEDSPAPASTPVATRTEAPTATRADASRAAAMPGAPPAWSSGDLFLRGGPGLGYVGQASWAASLELGVRLGRRALVVVGAEQVFSRTAALGPGDVTVSLRTGHLAVCGRVVDLFSLVEIAACGLAAVGALRGQSQNFPTMGQGTSAWWALGGGLRAKTTFRERWLLALAVEAAAPLYTYTFSVDRVGAVNGSGRWVGQILLGVGARLW